MQHRTFVLETPRLILRLLADEDEEAVHQLYADWDVAKSLSRLTYPFSVEAARRFIADARAGLVERSTYMLGMFERESGAFVGIVSLRVPSQNPALPEAERAEEAGLGILGYSVARPYWRRGFASEGAKRMVAFAFDELGLSRLQASVLHGNPASARVLERLGFTVVEAGVVEEPADGGPPRRADRYVLVRRNRAQ